MSSILKQFANGDLMMERPSNTSPEYKQALAVMVAIKAKLLAMLNDEGKVIFEEFLEAKAELEHINGIDDFIDGYSLGLMMTVEAFTTSKRH